MFEKIHSYAFFKQMVEEMEDVDGQLFLLPLTIHEKIWLKTLLESEEAKLFLQPKTIDKLMGQLENLPSIPQRTIIEKCKPDVQKSDATIYQFHKQLRELISTKSGFNITYGMNDGMTHEKVEGVPFKLEYMAHKNQWYVIWYPLGGEGTWIHTPLRLIYEVQPFSVDKATFLEIAEKFEQFIYQDRQEAVLFFNQAVFVDHSLEEEKQRIFYALSGFEKEVYYDEDTNQYEIKLYYREFEIENVLLKVRMLGKRVIIKSPAHLRARMRDTAKRALARYL